MVETVVFEVGATELEAGVHWAQVDDGTVVVVVVVVLDVGATGVAELQTPQEEDGIGFVVSATDFGVVVVVVVVVEEVVHSCHF